MKRVARILLAFMVTLAPRLANAQMYNDIPASPSVVTQPFTVAGWATDTRSSSGSGVDTVHIWAYPTGLTPVFLGAASYGGYRPDVGAYLGAERFSYSGYGLIVNSLPPGSYQIVVYAHSTVTNLFDQAVVVVVTIPQTAVSPPYGSTIITVGGDRFHVNGTAKRLLFVSYFDGSDNLMGPSQWDTDFSYFRGLGVDGIRVFPNWWTRATKYGESTPSDHALFDCNGYLNNGNINQLKALLAKAADYGLIVDVTFTHETICSNMNVDTYKDALRYVTPILSAYRNVIFDLQNEWPLHGISENKAQEIKAAIKQQDSQRLVVASTSGYDIYSGPHDQWWDGCAEEGRLDEYCGAGAFAARQGMSAVDLHDPRDPNWYWWDKAHWGWVGSGGYLPVLLSEPMPFGTRYDEDSIKEHFLTAYNNTVGADAPGWGWTFHSRTNMALNGQSLKSILDSPEGQLEKQALEYLAAQRPR